MRRFDITPNREGEINPIEISRKIGHIFMKCYDLGIVEMAWDDKKKGIVFLILPGQTNNLRRIMHANGLYEL